MVFHCFSPYVATYCCAKRMESVRSDLIAGLAGECVLELSPQRTLIISLGGNPWLFRQTFDSARAQVSPWLPRL